MDVKRYSTLPTTVEACQWDGTQAEVYFLIGWVLREGGTAWAESGKSLSCDVIHVETSTMRGNIVPEKGWIVKEPNGSFRVLTDKTFNSLYVASED